MRGAIDGLANPFPMGLMLPGMFQGDDFVQRFTAGLDDALAPLLSTLDNLEAYFDPELAPMDFAAWLAQWVGVPVDEEWSAERKRQVVAQAASLYGRQGTVVGLRDVIALYTGAEVEVDENGGVAWSALPGGEFPGSPEPKVKVTIRASTDEPVNAERVERLVAAAVPAHVPFEVEVRTG